jgi:hypothetical protein
MLFYFACEATGASSTRHSPRPHLFGAKRSSPTRAQTRRENAEVCVVRSELAAPSLRTDSRIGGLHPSPHFLWGGWRIVSGANDVTGGDCFMYGRATPPDWRSASHPPHNMGGKRRASFARVRICDARECRGVCVLLQRTEKCSRELFAPSLRKDSRIGGLHPSPHFLWGGWRIVSGANDVTGGGCFTYARARATPPDWPSASHPPHKMGGKRRASFAGVRIFDARECGGEL